MIGIYKITSPSGKVYIGQSWNIEQRWACHRSTKDDVPLYRSLRKHGNNNHIFEVVHELPIDVSQSVMDSYEQLYMDAFRDAGIELLNAKEGGLGAKHSNESKNKIGRANKGNKRPDLAEYNRRFKKGRPGHLLTEETRRKISEANIGRHSWAKGKPQSEEHKRNRSIAIKKWWDKRKEAAA